MTGSLVGLARASTRLGFWSYSTNSWLGEQVSGNSDLSFSFLPAKARSERKGRVGWSMMWPHSMQWVLAP